MTATVVFLTGALALGQAVESQEKGEAALLDGHLMLSRIRRQAAQFPLHQKGVSGAERVRTLAGQLGAGPVHFDDKRGPAFVGVYKRPKEDAIGHIERRYWHEYPPLVRSVRFESREQVRIKLPFDFKEWYVTAPVSVRTEFDGISHRYTGPEGAGRDSKLTPSELREKDRQHYIWKAERSWNKYVQFPWYTIEVETAWDSTWPADAEYGKRYEFTGEFQHAYVVYGCYDFEKRRFAFHPDRPPEPRLVIVMRVPGAGGPDN